MPSHTLREQCIPFLDGVRALHCCVRADWASKVPFRQGGFRETGSSSRESAGLVGSLPSKNRAAVDFLVDERFASAVANDPQYLIDGNGALPELRRTLTDTCREEWPTMKDSARAKFTELASGGSSVDVVQ